MTVRDNAMADERYKTPSYEDITGCQVALFEWAESYDTKDWDRLAKCVAPTLQIDYSSVLGKQWDSIPADEFVAFVSNPKFLGNQLIKTQHFIGVSKWVKTSDETMTGYHQMRVAHQRYSDDALTEVSRKGHAHGGAIMQYRKVDGVWKFAGLEPKIRWAEFDIDKVFQDE